MINPVNSDRVLFVWDGTKPSVAIADQYIQASGIAAASCLHVMPHESICAYATPGYSDLPPRRLEKKIRDRFGTAAGRTENLRLAKLEIVFGDRIQEVLRYGEIVKATSILMPVFQQSRFSSWIHGDLNQRLFDSASCPVTFYDADLNTFDVLPEIRDRDLQI